jgi:hypothetical protein
VAFADQPSAVLQSEPKLLLEGFGGEDHVSPTQILDEAAIENEDDDYWDVESDEDMFDIEDEADHDTLLASEEFNNIRRLHADNFNELGVRRYDAFLYDGLLSHYKPEYAANPLRNPKTARVFAHYIHVVSFSCHHFWNFYTVSLVHSAWWKRTPLLLDSELRT